MTWTQFLATVVEFILSVVVVEEDILKDRGDGLLGLDNE
jgi:hypothetical protein